MDAGTTVLVSATANIHQPDASQQSTVQQKDSGVGIDMNIQDFIQNAENYLQQEQETFQMPSMIKKDHKVPQTYQHQQKDIIKDLVEDTSEINSTKSNPQFWSVGAKQKIIGNNLLPFPASKKLLRNQLVPKIGDKQKRSYTQNSKHNSPRIIVQEMMQNQNGIFIDKKRKLSVQQVGTLQFQQKYNNQVDVQAMSFMEKKAYQFVAPPNTRFFKNRRNTTTLLQPLPNHSKVIESPRGHSVIDNTRNVLKEQTKVHIPLPKFKHQDFRNLTTMDRREQSPLSKNYLDEKKKVNLNVVVDEIANYNQNFENQTDQTAMDARSQLNNKSTYLSGVLQNAGSPYMEDRQTANFLLLPEQNFGIQSPGKATVASEQSQNLNLLLNTEGVFQIPKIRLEAIEYERKKHSMKVSQTSGQMANLQQSQNKDLQSSNLKQENTIIKVQDTDPLQNANHIEVKKKVSLFDGGSADIISIPSQNQHQLLEIHKQALLGTASGDAVKQPTTMIQLTNLVDTTSKRSTTEMAAMMLQQPLALQKQQYIIAIAKECSFSRTSNSPSPKEPSPNASPRTLKNTSNMTGGRAKIEVHQVKAQEIQQPEVFISSKATFSPNGAIRQDTFKITHRSRFSTNNASPTQSKTIQHRQSTQPAIWNQNNAFLKEKIVDYQHHIPKIILENQRKLIEVNDSNNHLVKQTESKDTMKGIKYNYQNQPTGGLTQTELANSIHQFHQNADINKQQVSRDILLPRPNKLVQQVLDNSSINSQRENHLKAFSQRTLPQNNISQQSLKKDTVEQPIQKIDGDQIIEAERGQTPQSETGSPISPKRLTSKIFSKIVEPAIQKKGLTLKVVNMDNNSISAIQKNMLQLSEKKDPSSIKNIPQAFPQQQFGAVKTQAFPLDPSFEQLNAVLSNGQVIPLGSSKNTARSSSPPKLHEEGYNKRNQLIPKFQTQLPFVKRKCLPSLRLQNMRDSKQEETALQSPRRELTEMKKSIDQAFEIFESYAKAGRDMPFDQTNPSIEFDTDLQTWNPTPRDQIVIGGQNLFEFAVGGMTAPIQQKVLQMKTYQLPLGELPEDHKLIEAYNRLINQFPQSEINQLSNFLSIIQQLNTNSKWKKQIIEEVMKLQKQALLNGISKPTAHVIKNIQRNHPKLQETLIKHFTTIQDSSSLQMNLDTRQQMEDADSIDQSTMRSPSPINWRPPATAENKVKSRKPMIVYKGYTRVHSGNFRDQRSQEQSETRNQDSVNFSKTGEFKGDNVTINNSKQGENADSFLDGLSGGRILKNPVVKTKVTLIENEQMLLKKGPRSISTRTTPKTQNIIDKISFQQYNKDPAIGKNQQKLVHDVIQSLVTGKKLKTQQTYHMKQGTSFTHTAKRHFSRGLPEKNITVNSNFSGMSRFSSTGRDIYSRNKKSSVTAHPTDRVRIMTTEQNQDLKFLQKYTLLPNDPQNLDQNKPHTAFENYRRHQVDQNMPTGFTNEAIMQSANHQDEETQSISAHGWSRNNFNLQKRSPTAINANHIFNKLINAPPNELSPFKSQTKQVSFARHSPQSARQNTIQSHRTKSIESETTSTVMPETCSVRVKLKNANQDTKQYIIKGHNQYKQANTLPQPSPSNIDYGMSVFSDEQNRFVHQTVKIAHLPTNIMEVQGPNHVMKQPEEVLKFLKQNPNISPINNNQDQFVLPANIGDTIDSQSKVMSRRITPDVGKRTSNMSIDIQILKDTKKYVQNEYNADLNLEYTKQIASLGHVDSLRANAIHDQQTVSASFRGNSGMQIRESQMLKSLGSPLLGSPKKSVRANDQNQQHKSIDYEENDFEEHVNSIDMRLIGAVDQALSPKHTSIPEDSKEATRQVQTSDMCSSPLQSEQIKFTNAFDSKQSSAQRKVMYQTKGNASAFASQNFSIPEKIDQRKDDQIIQKPRNSQLSPGAETIGMQELGSRDSEEMIISPLTPQRFDQRGGAIADQINIIQNDSHHEISPQLTVLEKPLLVNANPYAKQTKISTPNIQVSPPKRVPRLNLHNLGDLPKASGTARGNEFVGISQLISDSQIASVLTSQRDKVYSPDKSNQQFKQTVYLQGSNMSANKFKETPDKSVNQSQMNSIQETTQSNFSIYEFERQFQATIKNLKQADEPYRFKKHQTFWQSKTNPKESKVSPRAVSRGANFADRVLSQTNSGANKRGEKLPAAINNPLQVMHTRDMIQCINVYSKDNNREDLENYNKKVIKVKTSLCQNNQDLSSTNSKINRGLKAQESLKVTQVSQNHYPMQISGHSKKINYTLLEAIRQDPDFGKQVLVLNERDQFEFKIPDERTMALSQTVTPLQASGENINQPVLKLQPVAILQKQESVETTGVDMNKKHKLTSPSGETPIASEAELKQIQRSHQILEHQRANAKMTTNSQQQSERAQIIRLYNASPRAVINQASTSVVNAIKNEDYASAIPLQSKQPLKVIQRKMIDHSNSHEASREQVTKGAKYFHDTQEQSKDLIILKDEEPDNIQ